MKKNGKTNGHRNVPAETWIARGNGLDANHNLPRAQARLKNFDPIKSPCPFCAKPFPCDHSIAEQREELTRRVAEVARRQR